MAGGILVSRPGIEPMHLAEKAWSLTTGPPRKSLVGTFWHFFGHTTWDLSSPTRDQNHSCCGGHAVLTTLDHPGVLQ